MTALKRHSAKWGNYSCKRLGARLMLFVHQPISQRCERARCQNGSPPYGIFFLHRRGHTAVLKQIAFFQWTKRLWKRTSVRQTNLESAEHSSQHLFFFECVCNNARKIALPTGYTNKSITQQANAMKWKGWPQRESRSARARSACRRDSNERATQRAWEREGEKQGFSKSVSTSSRACVRVRRKPSARSARGREQYASVRRRFEFEFVARSSRREKQAKDTRKAFFFCHFFFMFQNGKCRRRRESASS